MFFRIGLAACLIATSSLSYASVINLYGAGGPHHAFEEAAKDFMSKKENSDIKINITYGPLSQWESCAKKTNVSCKNNGADILWGTSEHVTFTLIEEFKNYGFNSENSLPIYLRPAVILVQKGNPKNIHSFSDLIHRDDIKKIIVNSQTLGTVTSGTAVWEDIVGRNSNIDDIINFRKKIIFQGQGSGASFNHFKKTNADAWISWPEWYKNNQEKVDLINIEPARAIYRDLTITLKEDASYDTRKFYNYLISGKADNIFKKYYFTR